ncbi:primary replicative DNA helicase /intein [Sediminihabitans luteus]|uniref:Replicative DNA helicase n=1 Tax=Sediminihabitans luteus TaxID=1138585 RepID=A0A2M9D1C8_9CELL|nr:replicative DNA helicase [Sediminihabitans luteus]PJJ77970.1 primary replicative DNA helicase /intein [Sediminihabitans luteus]GIJ00601.1 replicative DNA helicase [Sediminihabitans luteus]
MSIEELEAGFGESRSGGGGFDRTPPQDVAAEQSVLGGMLLSKDAIADVVEQIRGTDFYRPAHEAIYDAIIDLYGRGEPADAITVVAELQNRGELGRIGGAPYVHDLIAMVPTAANAGYYGRIVRERAVLRRLVEAGTRIVQLGYAADGGDVDAIVNDAQAEVYAVTERRTTEDYAPLADIIGGTVDEIEAAGHRGEGMVGVPTGFADLDRLTNGLHPGQMIVVAARPAIGKSTLGIDIVRSAAIKHNMTSVVFSLEMSRNEITMRLLAAEARIHLQKMRNGSMGEDDWQKLASTMGKISEAPLFIDDSPNMSLMEIRAKCRRLKQKHDLKLVVIDYLQLMTSGKRVESRQQEVSEFSRALKLLAKELEVPLIAISQLNRGAEQRQDKKPAMSDLRESGCLTADTKILRADTGAETTMGELHALGATDVPVWALNDRLQYVRRHMTHVFPTGVKEVFRLRLASGKQITATANHPFLTYGGWRPLGTLEVGTRLGVPRHVPGPEQNARWDDRKVVMLAHLLGDGSFVKRQPLRYASVDELNLQAVTEAASAFGVIPARDEFAAARCTTLRLRAPYRLTHGKRNPIAEWLDDLGLFGARSYEKFIPSSVFHLPKEQIALFIRHIWATDGSVTVRADGKSGRIYYASTSRNLVDGLSRLLLRFGISTRLRTATAKGTYRPGYTLDVSGADDQRRFLQEIGVHGERGAAAERLLEIVRAVKSNPNVDTVPRQVWDDVRELLEEQGMSHREFARQLGTQFSGSAMWKRSPSPARLGRVAAILESEELEILAVNDLLWDEVVAIEPLGEQEVFDATVLDTHNFIANGIAVHNSIEQDADMVILLHREDAYEKESPRAGEADLIVAKHRNGPTDVITVAFQGHYARFVDMQA